MCAFFGSPLRKLDGKKEMEKFSSIWSRTTDNIQLNFVVFVFQQCSETVAKQLIHHVSICRKTEQHYTAWAALLCEGALTLVRNNSVAFTSQKGTNLPSKDKATLLYDIANFLLEFHYGRRGKPKTWGMVVVVNGSKHFIFFMIRRFFWTRAMTERTLTIPHV